MNLTESLKAIATSERALINQRYFKSGKGEYGEGDVFIGVTVPHSRSVARKFFNLPLEEIKIHLQSRTHEERLTALFILVEKYKKAQDKKEIVNFYLSNLKYVNNWDLVDSSADKILGKYLLDKDKSILYTLARSHNLWEKRVSIISTFHFIQNRKFEDTFKLAEILMNDKHDLIHKAVGWMLREVGKRNPAYLETFLKMHYKKMPRTMLRYSIEKFSKGLRTKYLKGEI